MADLQDLLSRLWGDLLARPSGPLHLRLLVQPLMAAILGVRDGIADARAGRSPYLWTIATASDLRRGRLREGVAATAKILILAFLLDTVYQLMVLRAFYPGEALIVGIVLAFIPYLLVRGPAARLARPWVQARVAKGADDDNGSISA